MSLNILHSDEAQADILAIADYIARDSLNASDRFLQATADAFRKLADFPGIGTLRDFDNPAFEGMRSWAVPGFPNHLIFYVTTAEELIILRVLHGARDLDSIFASSPGE